MFRGSHPRQSTRGPRTWVPGVWLIDMFYAMIGFDDRCWKTLKLLTRGVLAVHLC